MIVSFSKFRSGCALAEVLLKLSTVHREVACLLIPIFNKWEFSSSFCKILCLGGESTNPKNSATSSISYSLLVAGASVWD